MAQTPIPGSPLTVHVSGAEQVHEHAPVVIAVHGITANGLAFGQLAGALTGAAQVWAPDLRGRAESRDVGEPYGLAAHANDVITLLEAALAATGRPAVLLGHSMGAFVCALSTARRPELVARLVLVDGGLAFPLPAGTSPDDVDAMIGAVIGPAMARLSMTFDSPDDYLAFWAEHPALGALSQEDSPLGEFVRAYLLHDLVDRAEGGYGSSCRIEAIRADGEMTLTDAETHAAPFAAVAAGVPVSLLWAPRGLMNEPQGLYDEQRIAALNLPAALSVAKVPDVNHYTVLFDPAAVAQLAEALRPGLAGTEES